MAYAKPNSMPQVADGDLFAVSLIRAYWPRYLLVAALSVMAHVIWSITIGPAPSTDYGVVYDPAAKAVLRWIGGDALPAGMLSSYGWSHIGYIAFIAFCYGTFGEGSLNAVIYTQVAIVWLIYPLLFHILLYASKKPQLALAATLIYQTFYDGYLWHFWAVPDSIYRLLFVSTFFVLLRLWQVERKLEFASVTGLFLVVGSTFRIETVLYVMPAIVISLSFLIPRSKAAVIGICLLLVVLISVAHNKILAILNLFWSFQARGLIFDGLGYHVAGLTYLQPPTDSSVVEWGWHLVKLFAIRVYYAITPFPEFWSISHKIVYALYAIPAYVLLAFGLSDATKRVDKVYFAFAWVFFAGLLLRGLAHVDPPLRYGYSPQIFLFVCAALGFPSLVAAIRLRLSSAPNAR